MIHYMYNPVEAQKSYLILLKDRGTLAAFKSLGVVSLWYFFNEIIYGMNTPTFVLSVGYAVFLAYFTWKPKLARFLRGELRGSEWRDKAD